MFLLYAYPLNEAFRKTGSTSALPAASKTPPAASAAASVGRLANSHLPARLLAMDEMGRMVDTTVLLYEKGFEVGHYVRRDNDDSSVTYGMIQSIAQGMVTVYSTSKEDAEKVFTMQANEFVEAWHTVSNAEELRDAGAVPGWPLLGPDHDLDGNTNVKKAAYLRALYAVWEHFNTTQGDLPIMVNTKPRKHVVALKPLKANSLILVPYSTSLVYGPMPDKGKHIASVIVDCELSPKHISHVLHIQPLFQPPTMDKPNQGKIVPFWAVECLDSSQSGSDEENCEVVPYLFSTATVFPAFVGEHGARHTQSRFRVPVLVLTKDIDTNTRLAYVDKNWVLQQKPAKALKASARAVAASCGETVTRKRTVDMLGPDVAK